MAPDSSPWAAIGLALRSFLWAALLPGLFAGYLPWSFFGVGQVPIELYNLAHLAGLVGIGLGTALLSVCIWEFARSGRGTLAPVDPPRTLVIRGPYRYVRNPMYLGVTAIVLGEVVLTRSGALMLYWGLWFLAANLFVMGYEEPTLRQQFGASYEEYTRRVGRWLPRLRP